MVNEMKEKVRKEYIRRVKAVAGSKLYTGRLLQAVNILDWTGKELQAMDTKTRKLLTMNGGVSPE